MNKLAVKYHTEDTTQLKSGYDPLLSMRLLGEIKEVKFEMSCMKREIEGLCKIMQKLSVSQSNPQNSRLKKMRKKSSEKR